MTTTAALMVVGMSVAAAGFFGLLLRRIVLDGKRRPVPGYERLYCEGAAPERVALFVALALRWMATCFDKEAALFRNALLDWTVVVMPTTSWQRVREDGRLGAVGGFLDSMAKRLEVAPDFDGLAHEMAHLFELYFRGQTDSFHVTWEAKGIYPAIRGYQADRRAL